MFNKSQRINSREFTKIFSLGKKYFSPNFRCVSLLGDFKISVVIPKKILKKRIERNREKRRILHILKHINIQKNITGMMIIFIQKNTQNLSTLELTQELQTIIKKQA